MEEEALMASWSDGSEEEDLLRELLDDEPPLVVITEEAEAIIDQNYCCHNNRSSSENEEAIMMNRFISNVYSGPTIADIENALSVTNHTQNFYEISSSPRVSIWERSLNVRKINENKHTLKIKCFGNRMSDDGYKWRKYGQKSIKNSTNPRSYYRCTNPRCNAKKHVERSTEEPDTLIVTYEGLHLHFPYPYFLMGPPQQAQPPPKKTKTTILQAQIPDQESQHSHVGLQGAREAQETQDMAQESMGPQGLLEDIVPLMIRNPS